jgi:DNA mismatch repair protein MutS2
MKEIDETNQSSAPSYEGEPPETVQAGDSVFITTTNTYATVLSKPDEKGDIQLQAGIIKLTANISVLRKSERDKKDSKQTSGRIKRLEHNIPHELDIRGMTVGEAEMAVDAHLDAATLSGLHQATIIHGKGTGVLRAGIKDFLRTHGHVEEFRLGRYGEGESGVTVVTLKQR